MATVPQFPAGTLARSALNTFVTETTTNITDTNIAVGANIAISKTALGTYTAWTDYTPTLVQTGAVTKSIVNSRYMQVGKKITVQGHLVCTGSGTGGSLISIGLPVNAVYSNQVIGYGYIYNADIAYVYKLILRTPVGSSSTIIGIVEGASGTQGAGINPNFALANDDEINFTVEYEVA